jgi:hypothetical protein
MTAHDYEALRAGVRTIVEDVVRPWQRALAEQLDALWPSNNIAREWIGKTLVGLPLELFEAGGE